MKLAMAMMAMLVTPCTAENATHYKFGFSPVYKEVSKEMQTPVYLSEAPPDARYRKVSSQMQPPVYLRSVTEFPDAGGYTYSSAPTRP